MPRYVVEPGGSTSYGMHKRRTFGFCRTIAEPKLIFYKDNASARAMKLDSIAEPKLIFYKDNANRTQ